MNGFQVNVFLETRQRPEDRGDPQGMEGIADAFARMNIHELTAVVVYAPK
jgi:hypothetical protein